MVKNTGQKQDLRSWRVLVLNKWPRCARPDKHTPAEQNEQANP